MWYVMQTVTGREEELVRMVKKTVSRGLYKDCFVVYYERLWRRQGRSIIHVERLFPGYVFIEADEPEGLYLGLKHVPAMARLLSDGECGFIPLQAAEEEFLSGLMGEGRTVGLSYVGKDGQGHVRRVDGPLQNFLGQAVKYQFKKRYAVIRFKMFGMEKTAVLGIFLDEDVRQGLAYQKDKGVDGFRSKIPLVLEQAREQALFQVY